MHHLPSNDGTIEGFGAIRQQHRKLVQKQSSLNFETTYDQEDGIHVSN
jgi:hypothetical protein